MFTPGLLFTETFFAGSLDLSNYSQEIDRIGINSANGFIRKLNYKDNSLSMDVVLKSAANAQADNLYYEYLAGQCINEFSKFYPFFSRTFGIGKYKSNQTYNALKSIASKNLLSAPVHNFIEPMNLSDFETTISESCQNSLYMTIFTQFIPIDGSLWNYFTSFTRNSVFRQGYQNQLTKHIAILFMVYGSLHKLSDFFTHYDLHMDNIALYAIPNAQYIDVEAKTENGVISFKTKYIPIIIDYGRSYFNCSAIESHLVNSPTVMKSVCLKDSFRSGSPVCVRNCGDYVGYSFTGQYNPATDSFNATQGDDFFINRAKRNKSHDLRGLSDLKRSINFSELDSSISYIRRWKQIIEHLNYNARFFGKPETSSVMGQFNNVTDIFRELSNIMLEPEFIRDHDQHYKTASYGKLVLDFSNTMEPFIFTKA
jgi:hypothetical protein